jgi:hypothetical protein
MMWRNLILLLAFLSSGTQSREGNSEQVCNFSTDPDNLSPIFWYLQTFSVKWTEAPPALDGWEGFSNSYSFNITLKNILLDDRVAICYGSFSPGPVDQSSWVICDLDGGPIQDRPVVSARVGQCGNTLLALRQTWDCKDDGYSFAPVFDLKKANCITKQSLLHWGGVDRI